MKLTIKRVVTVYNPNYLAILIDGCHLVLQYVVDSKCGARLIILILLVVEFT